MILLSLVRWAQTLVIAKVIAGVYNSLVGLQEVRYSDGVRSEKYICWTRKQMRYMLGDHGYSYVVGSSPPNRPGQFPRRVHNRGASCPAAPANCSQVTALYNPQDNPHTIEGALVLVSPPAAVSLLNRRRMLNPLGQYRWHWRRVLLGCSVAESAAAVAAA